MSEAIETKQENLPQTLHEVFSPVQITLLDQISSAINYSLIPLPNAKPKDVGFATDIQRKIIYFNPHNVHSMSQSQLFACFGHELGHHFPHVLETQRAFERLMPIAEQLIPDVIPNKKKLCNTLLNILLDILLEYMIPKDGATITTKLFRASFRQNRGLIFIKGKPEEEAALKEFDDSDRLDFPWREAYFKDSPRFNQFQFISLVGPFFDFPDPKLVHPDVANTNTMLQSIIHELVRADLDAASKAHLYIQYVKIAAELIDKDVDELSEEATDMLEAISDLVEKIEGELEKADAVIMPGEVIGEESGDEDGDELFESENGKPEKASIAANISENLRSKLKSLSAKVDDEIIAEQAKLLGLRPEVYKFFLSIKEEYKSEINSLTETLAKFVLRDFKKMPKRRQKQGMMITPGREVETYQRSMAGEEQPATYTNRFNVRAPKTLQLYNLADTSRSMYSDLEGTLGFYTIITLASLNIADELRKNPAKYNTRAVKNSPVEIELVGFDNAPKLVIPLIGRINMKEIAQGFQYIIDRTAKGKFTNDEKALKFEYNRMSLHNKRVLKILSMITDGGGQGDAIEPILRQIEEDRSIFFMVNGIGTDGSLVKEFYQKKFRPAYYYHVYAEESKNVREAIPKTINFIQGCIKDHFS